MMYRKLKRTWSHNDADITLTWKFREVFPELKNISTEEMVDRLIDLKFDFYSEEKDEVKFWIRLTLPFALLTFVLMFLFMPVNFMIRGEWGYNIDKKNRIYNWFKSLRLI